MRIPLGILNWFLRRVERRAFARITDHTRFRRRFARQGRFVFRQPQGVAYVPDHLTDAGRSVPAQWVQAGPKMRDGVILYLHGGAYAVGGPVTHRAMLARLSSLTGLRAVLPDYRKAPEHPFPAAHEDAVTAYRALLARGYPPGRIVLGGDSAGGGLMLALLHEICSQDLPRPGAAFAFSPWTDLTLSGGTITSNAARDVLLPAERTAELRDLYLNGADAKDPRASPLFGQFKGAPDIRIDVGSTEILLEDSRRMAKVLKSQGVTVQLHEHDNLPHVWPIFQGLLAEADQTLRDVADFIGEVAARNKMKS